MSESSLLSLDELTNTKYQCIIFEDFRAYLNLDDKSRAAVDSYMKAHKVGMVAFLPAMVKGGMDEQVTSYPLRVHNKLRVQVSIRADLSPREVVVVVVLAAQHKVDRIHKLVVSKFSS